MTRFTRNDLAWFDGRTLNAQPWLDRTGQDIELELGLVEVEPSNDTDHDAEVWTINLEQAS